MTTGRVDCVLGGKNRLGTDSGSITGGGCGVRSVYREQWEGKGREAGAPIAPEHEGAIGSAQEGRLGSCVRNEWKGEASSQCFVKTFKLVLIFKSQEILL